MTDNPKCMTVQFKTRVPEFGDDIEIETLDDGWEHVVVAMTSQKTGATKSSDWMIRFDDGSERSCNMDNVNWRRSPR